MCIYHVKSLVWGHKLIKVQILTPPPTIKRKWTEKSRLSQISISALKQQGIGTHYFVEVNNKLDRLIYESLEHCRVENPEENINTQWECPKSSRETASVILPVKESKKKQL